jgi:K+-transporting ATPase ATPase A chain
MNNEITGVIVMFVLSVVPAIFLGKYMANLFEGGKTFLDFLKPLERLIFRISGIDPSREMTWKQNLKAMLTINLVWFLFSMFILMDMGWLPLNPDGNPSMTADTAFNTTVSFISNTNLQNYAPETQMSYLGQMVLMLFQFISAATGIAICIVVFNALKEGTSEKLGNFFNYLVLSCTRILLPMAIVVAVFLSFHGTPMTFEGKQTFLSLQKDTVNVSRGPVAAMVAIKQIGTNGGGFYGANSAHPLENPDYITNMVEDISIILIPIAMVFALGFYLKKKRLANAIFMVMTIGFLLFLIPAIYYEMNGSSEIANLGVQQHLGSMEGKEIRFGPAASAYWGVTTTVTSNGSVNAMHDSFTPITGMMAMMGMMVNCFYGGVGVGFLNYFIFIIIAVFIGGLMVGRTPELMGKKIESKEMKIAVIIALLHPLLILSFTALSSYMYASNPTLRAGWLNNPGYHGYSEMLYQYTSCSANNGSGFAGLGAIGSPFWNITNGIVMILSRYMPIIGPVAIAGILAQKKYIPVSAGTLHIDTGTFSLLTYGVIIIIAALAFFPALVLGPVAEFYTYVK